MGIFDRFRTGKRSTTTTTSDQSNASNFWWGLPTSLKGVDQVTIPSLAMKVATVYRCVDILSKEVAILPLEVQVNRGGYFVTDETSTMNYLLSVHPNDRQNAFDMMRNAMVQVLLRGNAFIYPEFTEDGWSKLTLISPDSWSYDIYSGRTIVNDPVNGIQRTFEHGELIHLRNLSLDGGYLGVSTISYAAKVIAISSNADEENNDTFKNGGTLKGFVSGNNAQTIGFGALQDQQLSDVASNVEKQLGSGKNIFSLPGEMRFNQISLSPADIQLLETKEFNVLEICRFFGVHPDKVFAQQSSNYKASEMSQVAFLTDTLQPYLRQFELEFQDKLIPREMYGKKRICFNLDNLMQTDLSTKAAYMEKTISTGTYTVNYWRKKNGQAPVEGGDTPLVSANLVPMNSAKLWGEKTDE